MARNSGSQIHLTHAEPSGAGKRFVWFCQQHSKWDSDGTFNTWKTHIENEHGCVEQ